MKLLSVPIILLAGAFILTGCRHPIDVTNLHCYHNRTITALDKPLTMRIRGHAADLHGHRMIDAITRDLLRYNIRAATRPEPNNPGEVAATISLKTDRRGSGWNYWADFPGFLVWFPAWHGYNYHVLYDIDIDLRDARTGKRINSLYIPVSLNVKHADRNRTWINGMSWPTLGLTSLIGGLSHMEYDETVTPLVNQYAGPVLADYVAQQIALTLQYYNTPLEERLEKLETMRAEQQITQEQYEKQREEIRSREL